MANVDDTPTGGSDIKYEKREFDSANETRVFNLDGIKANIATLVKSEFLAVITAIAADHFSKLALNS